MPAQDMQPCRGEGRQQLRPPASTGKHTLQHRSRGPLYPPNARHCMCAYRVPAALSGSSTARAAAARTRLDASLALRAACNGLPK